MKKYLLLVLGIIIVGINLYAQPGAVLQGKISGSRTLSADTVYTLRGYVFVDTLSVLNIPPGTLIYGASDATNDAGQPVPSTLIIKRGGKIYASGTATMPIVFTSSRQPGARKSGDWGGIVMNGRAALNNPGGSTTLEGSPGGLDWTYGGGATPDDNDSSGVLRFVRIEFAGFAFQPDRELNSLTMGGIGRRTLIEFVQVSYGNDDGFEWFGGTVNHRYLISTASLDDDFDSDNGYSGKVQFGLVQRYRQRADISRSQAFESDNDGSGSFNKPITSAVFTNITAIGPVRDTSNTSGSTTYSANFGSSFNIRRNSRTSIVNSVFVGWPSGFDIPTAGGTTAAGFADSVIFRYNTWIGVRGLNRLSADTAGLRLITTSPGNIITNKSGSIFGYAQMKSSAFLEDNSTFDPTPDDNAAVLSQGVSFAGTNTVKFDDKNVEGRPSAVNTSVTYRGAFAPLGTAALAAGNWTGGWGNNNPVNTSSSGSAGISHRWDLPWGEYDPVNATYYAPRKTARGVESNIKNSVLNANNLDVVVFPNPVQDAATVRFNLVSGSAVKIVVMNTIGNTLLVINNADVRQQGIHEFRVDTNSLPQGMYLIQVITPNGIATKSFTISR